MCWAKETSGSTKWKTHFLPCSFTNTLWCISCMIYYDSTSGYDTAAKSVICAGKQPGSFETRGAYGSSGSNDYKFSYICLGF